MFQFCVSLRVFCRDYFAYFIFVLHLSVVQWRRYTTKIYRVAPALATPSLLPYCFALLR